MNLDKFHGNWCNCILPNCQMRQDASRLLDLAQAEAAKWKSAAESFGKRADAAELQKEAKEQKLHRICQLIEAVPCICRQLTTFQQCKRCRIIELLAGEPGSSFTRVCTRDMKCPVTGHYHPQDPDLDEQT